jgi:ACS family allantoate permease-like MFS transporter
MQRFPTGKYITVNFILWGRTSFPYAHSSLLNASGVTLACSASASNFGTLAAARFFLGVFESCLNPGFVLITSSWWKREEQTARIGLWYCANGLFGAPSGIIFWGIAHIHVSSVTYVYRDDC